MDITVILSILGSLGFGGIIGGYLQHLWNKKRDIDIQIQTLNENKYRSTLVFMRCILKPTNFQQFDLSDPNFPSKASFKVIKNYSMNKVLEFYYNSTLYASDDVLKAEREFLNTPTVSNFFKTALAMRRDLWKKKSKIEFDELYLE
jgi:hypothetical protein